MSTPGTPGTDPIDQTGTYSASTNGHRGTPDAVVGAITDVSERVQTLVREEIELAKAEVRAKVNKLIRGAAIAAAAATFVLAALLLVLHGLAWLAYWAIPFPDQQIFWGFFVVAAVLLLLGGLAGYVAARAFRSATPPAPTMAIDEARRIKDTVTSPEPEATVPPEARP